MSNTAQETPAEGHNSQAARDAILQSEALEQVEIEVVRYELTQRQAKSMERVEATGVTRKAFREKFEEIKRTRNQSMEHKTAVEICGVALSAMNQAELFAKLDNAKAEAAAASEKAKEARKAKVDSAKKSVKHASADAKDQAVKNEAAGLAVVH